MKELVNNMLAEIEVDISEIDLYGYDIILLKLLFQWYIVCRRFSMI